MSPRLWLPTLGVAAALAGPAVAGPLTFAGALDRAGASAPSLAASALQSEAARIAARAAGKLPDPKLGLRLENFPISGPNAGRLDRDEMTMAQIGLVQEMPNAGRRGAAVEAATAAISEADARRAVELRKVRVATALAWIDLAYAERRLAALDAVVTNLQPLFDAQPSAVAAGRARPGQALTPIEMRARLEDQRSELLAAVARARAELTRWTGEAAPSAAGAAPHFEIEPAALRAGLESHPVLIAFRSAAAKADAEVSAARAAKRPDWSWDVSYGRRDPMFGDMLSAGVTVSLPLFSGRRQEPIIAARRADASRVTAEREDARRALAAQLETDLAEHVMHHDQWQRSLGVVAPAAQQRADLETSSYAAGAASLADVLDALAALADAKLTTLEREAMVTRDGARIVLTYGSDQ
jgi:outer membrane protein TolC